MNNSTNEKLYEHFAAPERLTLILEALARGDKAEADRLSGACPRKTYTMRDAAFGERLDVSFDIMCIACIDLRCIWGKLDILHWAIAGARLMATSHQIGATFAFMEGEHFGRGQPQMGFFRRRRPLPVKRDGHGGADDGDDLPAEPAAPPEPVRFSDVHEGEFATRMMAVEDRMQATTDLTFVSLLGAALALVRQLAEVWTAYDRFCRDRLGVSAETMLGAWDFPTGGEVVEMLGRYPDVKPDPAKVDEYAGIYCQAWDRRFGDK